MRRSITTLAIVLLMPAATLTAQTCISQGNGNWGTAATWSCNGTTRVPACGDTIRVGSGHTVTVANQFDFSGCGSTMAIDVYGTLSFTNGNKVRLPCGSLLSVQSGGLVEKDGSGGGTSTLISICGTDVWTAGDGDLNGPTSIGGFILPIELLSFEVEQGAEYTTFSWSTATETDNDYFSVYASSDGDTWELIQTENGAGNSSTQTDYVIEHDRSYPEGTVFRLDQTDYNGTTRTVSIAEPETLSDVTLGNSIAMYPNPSVGQVNFDFSRGDLATSLYITDLNGRLVHQREDIRRPNYSVKADQIGMSPGVYLVRIAQGRQVEQRKLVITRL